MRLPLAIAVASAGCVSVAHPPGFERREEMVEQRVTATPGIMYGSIPLHFDSPVGPIAAEIVELELESVFEHAYREVFRIELSGPTRADVLCRHEPEGPPLACRGAAGDQPVALDVWPGCETGLVTVGGARFELALGKVRVAGVTRPTGEATLRGAGGGFTAALEPLGANQFRVWTAREAGAHRVASLALAAAVHHWSAYASEAQLDPCK